MAKYLKDIPKKTASNLTVLGARFDDQGNPTEVKWFTEKGFKLIPDDLNYNKQGGKTRVKNGGWKQVDPNDFAPAPAPLTAGQVTGSPVADPNKLVVTEGVDTGSSEEAKTEGDGNKSEPGDANEGGDQGKKTPETKEAAKADPKAGGKK